MSQKSSFIQPANSVSQVLIPDKLATQSRSSLDPSAPPLMASF
jgi:K+-transporting ATPase c subunit